MRNSFRSLEVGLVWVLMIVGDHSSWMAMAAPPTRQEVKQFEQKWDLDRRKLDHQATIAEKQEKSAQKAQLKEWKKKEREARRKYFEEHKNGPERRAYVQDYLKRREEFEKSQNRALRQVRDEWATKRKDLKARRKSAREQLQNGNNQDSGAEPSPAALEHLNQSVPSGEPSSGPESSAVPAGLNSP